MLNPSTSQLTLSLVSVTHQFRSLPSLTLHQSNFFDVFAMVKKTGSLVQFSTYAVPMIVGEVKRYLRDNNSIRVSRSVRDLAYKAIQTKEKMTKEKGREPTIEEIAKELNVEKEEIAFSLDAIQDPVSLQEPVYNDGAESIFLMDQVKDSKNNTIYTIEFCKKAIEKSHAKSDEKTTSVQHHL